MHMLNIWKPQSSYLNHNGKNIRLKKAFVQLNGRELFKKNTLAAFQCTDIFQV